MAMSKETIIRRREERAYEKRMNALISVAHNVEVLDKHCSTPDLYLVSVIAGYVSIKGFVRDVNPVLEKLGFRPIRITSNMLNPESKKFAIDINTPAYCDPGCESYHTM